MDYVRIVLALVAVLSLIAALAFVARRAGLAEGGPAAFARRRRLQVVETLFLDPRRRAVILRCDGEEHLVLLGPAGETVVQSHLSGPVEAAATPDAAPSPFAAALKRLTGKRGEAVADAA